MNKKVDVTQSASEPFDQAVSSLLRVQDFDVESLPRQEELGRHFSFEEAVAPAKKLVKLFRQISATHLHELPDEQLNTVRDQADAVFKSLTQILEFDPAAENAGSQKQALINELSKAYQPHFSKLFPIIGYLASRIHDFTALETEGKATIQQLRDETEETTSEIKNYAKDAEEVLETIRRTAAEQGVSQHAEYFKKEAISHEEDAVAWRNYTLIATISLVILALSSLYMHHAPFLQVETAYQTVQVALSKVILFGIMGYILVLCARNFLAHRHNAVVNRHRQNALLTFKALADAAGSQEKQDIVLAHAASCIFSPQDTGYTKASAGGSSSNSATALMPYMYREASSS